MGSITLPSRQSLARRVHVFGGTNGRGVGIGQLRSRAYRFGDAVADTAAATEANRVAALMRSHADQALTDIRNGTTNRMTSIALDQNWHLLLDVYPSWAPSAYQTLLRYVGGNTSGWETIQDWVRQSPQMPGYPVTAALPPVITTTPTVPTTTDADYQTKVVADQLEAARLQAVATQRQAEYLAESRRLAAEDAAKLQAAQDAQNAAVIEPPKSNTVPLLIAAGLAFLVLKG